MKNLILFSLLVGFLLSQKGHACFQQPAVMDRDLVTKVHEMVAKTLKKANKPLDEGHCVKAAALNEVIYESLGFKEGQDFVLISTHLHIHTSIPGQNLISDPTIAQFFLDDPKLTQDTVSRNGFLGSAEEFYNFVEKPFGASIEGVLKTGWRLQKNNNNYLPVSSDSQLEAKRSAQTLAKDISLLDPQTSSGKVLRQALVEVLKECNGENILHIQSCSSENPGPKLSQFEEFVTNDKVLEIRYPPITKSPLD